MLELNLLDLCFSPEKKMKTAETLLIKLVSLSVSSPDFEDAYFLHSGLKCNAPNADEREDIANVQPHEVTARWKSSYWDENWSFPALSALR